MLHFLIIDNLKGLVEKRIKEAKVKIFSHERPFDKKQLSLDLKTFDINNTCEKKVQEMGQTPQR